MLSSFSGEDHGTQARRKRVFEDSQGHDRGFGADSGDAGGGREPQRLAAGSPFVGGPTARSSWRCPGLHGSSHRRYRSPFRKRAGSTLDGCGILGRRMKALFDTSIFVAALVHAHPRHSIAWPWLEKAHKRELVLHASTHSLAETYAVLSRLPIQPSIQPTTAARMIEQGILSLATLVSLDADDYTAVLRQMAESKHRGGIIYDALIARAAHKTDVDCLVTLNRRHFLRVWPEASHRIIDPQDDDE